MRVLEKVLLRVFFVGVIGCVGCSNNTSSMDGGNNGKDSSSQTTQDSSNTTTSSKGEQINDQCPSSSSVLIGTGAEGATCSSYSDCKPSCCACQDSAQTYLGAACIDGKCADKADTCWKTKETIFCEFDVPSDGGIHEDAPTNDTNQQGSQCVDGYSTDCKNNGGTWTGSLCCVDGAAECVDGYSTDCKNNGGLWTGKKCCVENAGQCVDGYSTDCKNNGGLWTGKMCCVQNVSQCVDGSSSDCKNNGGFWTGKLCCL